MHTKTKRTYREVILLFAIILLVLFFITLTYRLLFGKRATIVTEAISIRIEDIPVEYLEDVAVGDRVLDRTRRTILGVVEDISTTPHFYERALKGESVVVEKRGYCDATFRIRIEQENRRNQDGGVFYIGAGTTISTHSFVGDGKIVALFNEGESQ